MADFGFLRDSCPKEIDFIALAKDAEMKQIKKFKKFLWALKRDGIPMEEVALDWAGPLHWFDSREDFRFVHPRISSKRFFKSGRLLTKFRLTIYFPTIAPFNLRTFESGTRKSYFFN